MPSAAEMYFAMSLKGSAQATYVSLLKQQDQAQAQAEANRPRIPTRTPDNLSSTQYATFLDLLSEGEIEGFPSAAGLTKGTSAYNIAALKDIYLNKTPILRASANLNNVQSIDYNFQNVKIEPRYGTQTQPYIQGYGEISEPITVNSTVQQATPVIRTVNDVNVNGVIITITVPALQEFNTQGDILGASFSFTIALSYNGGAYTTVATETVSGRTADAYQRDYRVNFTTGWVGSVAIKLTRITADSADPATLVNAFQWSYYQEIIYQKLTYPNSAIVAIKFDAQQFTSLPSRTYRIRGIKVRVPTGVTVDQTSGRIIYPDGYTFNGTLTAENARVWTSDPAWILFDLLTNTRYGFGQYISDSQLDKPAFYAASAYASALVSNGLGGTEPRFSCNVLIQNQDDAYKLINDLSSVMRVMPYWATGALTISQDAPRDASYLFTMANVTEAGFSYSGSSLKTRHTCAVVSYLDTQTQEIAYEIVEDADAINKYGISKTELRAFACTSRGQAARLGAWVLYSEANETEVVTFATSVESGVIVRPGQVIKIADPLKAGIRRAGRINAATTTQITVDDTDNTDLTNLFNAKLTVIMPDGSIEERNITTVVGAVITVSTAYSTTPNVGSVWMLQNTNVEATTWRVLTVSENEGVEYQITALSHNPSKYEYVEQNRPLQKSNITITEFNPEAPTNIKYKELIYESNNKVKSKLSIRWQPVAGVSEYRVYWRRGNGNWNIVDIISAEYEILEVDVDTYYIHVYSLNPLRIPSIGYAQLTAITIGKTALPGNVENLTFEPISANSGRLRWDPSTDLDVRIGGKVHIRHSNLTDGSATWPNSVDLVEAKSGSTTEAIIPLISGEVLVKFEDDGGRQSSSETSIIIDLPDALGELLVQSQREDNDAPPFQGNKTNTFYSDEYEGLSITGIELFDNISSVDDIINFDIPGNIAANGIYEFTDTLDLGANYSLDLRRFFVTTAYFPSDSIDYRAMDVDHWTDFDGPASSSVNSKLYQRSTTDNPSGSPTWSAWQEFVNGTYKGRAFQFKAELITNDVSQNIAIHELGYEATFQRRMEQSSSIVSSGAGAYTITFDKPFFTGTSSLGGINSSLPSVGITAQNMASGDYFEINSISGSQFIITFRDITGTAISRNFTWSVVGYGKGV
jgi:predicted phage tail protein